MSQKIRISRSLIGHTQVDKNEILKSKRNLRL